MNKLVWNVFHYDINKKKIDTFNVFDHYSFLKYIKQAIEIHKNKEKFAEQIERELFYYYGYKAEWEVIIAPWVGGDRKKDAIKIDVYTQVMNNWEVFVDYVWNNKEELSNEFKE